MVADSDRTPRVFDGRRRERCNQHVPLDPTPQPQHEPLVPPFGARGSGDLLVRPARDCGHVEERDSFVMVLTAADPRTRTRLEHLPVS